MVPAVCQFDTSVCKWCWLLAPCQYARIGQLSAEGSSFDEMAGYGHIVEPHPSASSVCQAKYDLTTSPSFRIRKRTN